MTEPETALEKSKRKAKRTMTMGGAAEQEPLKPGRQRICQTGFERGYKETV